jgi:hypothetical protein
LFVCLDFQLNATDASGKKLDQWTKHLATSAGVSPDFPQELEKHCCELGFVKTDYRLADLPLGEWAVTPSKCYPQKKKKLYLTYTPLPLVFF